MDKKLSHYEFKGIPGQQFPFDKNTSQFEKNYELSRNQLSRALSALGPLETSITNPLHFLVYFENRSTSYAEYIKNSGNYTNKNSIPIPATIYWEIEDLIAAIVNAANKNKGANRDTICTLALDQLAADNANRITETHLKESSYAKISDKALDSFLTDPKAVNFLKNNSLQRKMIAPHIDELSLRFNTIQDLLLHLPPNEMANALFRLLQELDTQIAHLSTIPADTTLPNNSFDSVLAYIDDLLRVRRASQLVPFPLPSTYDPAKHHEVRAGVENFRFPAPQCPTDMVTNMSKWQELAKANSDIAPGLKASTLSDYSKYLINRTPKKDIESAKQFAIQYTKLKLYLTLNSRDDPFEEAIRSEVYSFLCTEFSDLDHYNLIQYQVKDYSSVHQSEAVVNDLLQNGYTQIRFKLHNAFHILLHINVLLSCSIPLHTLDFEQIRKYTVGAFDALHQLAELYPDKPLFRNNNTPDILEFLSLQHKTSAAHINCKQYSEDDLRLLQYNLNSGTPAICLATIVQLLRIQCEIVACLLAEDLVRDVISDHGAVHIALEKHKPL